MENNAQYPVKVPILIFWQADTT